MIETDASLKGWRAVCRKVWRGGLWLQLEQQKHIYIDGRYVHSPGLCEEQVRHPCPPEDGQHLSTGLCDQDGRNSFTSTYTSGLPNVGLVPPGRNNPVNFTSSQVEQCSSGLRVQGSTYVNRVETKRGCLSLNSLSPGAMQSGSVHHTTEQSVARLE